MDTLRKHQPQGGESDSLVAEAEGNIRIPADELDNSQSRWKVYAVALGSVAVATVVQWAVRRVLGDGLYFILFYPAVMAAAIVGGLWAGLLATVLSAAFGIALFFLEPWQLGPNLAVASVRLAIFLLVGVFVSILCEQKRRVRRELRARAVAAEKAQAALRDSETRFHSIFNQAAIGLCLATPNGMMLVVNSKLCQMLGYTSEELRAKTYEEITYPEDWPAQVVQAKRLVAGEIDSYTMEKRYIRKDGSLVWAQLTCSAVRLDQLYVVVIVEDIGARKEIEKALREAQERYAALFERSVDCVFILDFDGQFLDANLAALQLLGYTKEEIRSTNLVMVVDPAQLELARQRLEETRRVGHTAKPVEFQLLGKDGQTVYVETRSSLILHDGKPIAIQGIGRDVTDRRRAEEALRESEEKFRSLAENMHAAVGMVQGKRFVYANEFMAQMLGYTVQEILSMDFPQLVHPRDQERMIDRARRRQLGEPVPTNYEFMALTKSGEVRWMDFSVGRTIFRGKPAIIGTGVDITERKNAEERLKSIMRGFRLLADTGTRLLSTERPRDALAGVFDELAEHLGIKVYLNYLVAPDGEHLHLHSHRGLDPAVARQIESVEFGQTLCGTVAQERRPVIVENVQQSSDPKAALLRPLGIRAYACHPLLGHSQVIGTLSFCADDRDCFTEDELELMRIVSHQAAMGLEHQRLTEELERRADALTEASRAKDQFLAVLSHELRTPLTPVLAAAMLLERDGRLPNDAAEDVQMIRRNVELEARLIDDLLDLTRVARGKLELRKEKFEVCQMLQHAVEVCSSEIDAKNLHFGVDLGGGNRWMRGDPARLQQVFWNLINNAIKFTPSGGCVGVRCYDGESDQAVIEVVDSGVGIEPELLPRIFNAFEQGGRPVTRQFGGLGLGLAISKALVSLHGGTIEAHSAGKGRGATFRVKLPIISPELKVLSPESKLALSTQDSGLSTQRPLRILLVEDHVDTARLMSQLLRMEGHHVEVAGTVAAALDLGEHQPFDLIISDLGLPDGSGLDVMKRLREEGHGLKGIALSGFGMDDDIARSREAGFKEHLVKPVKLDHLEGAIVRVMAD